LALSKVIGILGGMGPLATIDLFGKIVRNTPAKQDQDHFRILIYNNPKIPSRIDAILNGAENPLQELSRTAQVLAAAGAEFIVMPCHTAHYWYEELQANTPVPIVNMIRNTVVTIQANYPDLANHILLLSTTATLKMKLYQKAFQSYGFQLHVPNPLEQELIQSTIKEAKASRIESNPYLEPFTHIINRYQAKGLKAILGACTEIPLLFPYLDTKMIKLDPTLMLALSAIRIANGEISVD
jgi:aspartate racemase